jgi:hypothetical protein
MIVLEKPFFPSSLGTVLEALKGGISKTPSDFQSLMIMVKNQISSLAIRYGKYTKKNGLR